MDVYYYYFYDLAFFIPYFNIFPNFDFGAITGFSFEGGALSISIVLFHFLFNSVNKSL